MSEKSNNITEEKWKMLRNAQGMSRSKNPLNHRECIRESPPRFETRIMAWVHVRSFTRSTMYKLESSILLVGTGVLKSSSVACGFSSIKIDYYDYPISLISRINDVYIVVFFNRKTYLTSF